MTTQITKHENLSAMIKRPEYSGRFTQLLKDRADQFISSIIQVGQSMPDVSPPSIIAAGMMAASLDLPVNKSLGFAWIVPYKENGQKVAQFQIGYKGYIQLGLRSGAYSRMNATPINAEAFAGYDEIGEPVIDWKKLDPTKPAFGFAFGFKLTNGFVKLAFWTKAECRAHAEKFSQSFRAKAAIWREFEDEMFLKTVISNELRKWGILSVQMQRAMFLDQTAAASPDSAPTFVDGASAAGMIAGGDAGSQAGNPDERAEADAGLAPTVKTAGEALPKELVERQILEAAEARRREKAAQVVAEAPVNISAASAKGTVIHGTTPQELIAKGCTEHGISFDKFRQWAGQFIKDADSLTEWSELPADKCSTWLLAEQDAPGSLFTEISEWTP